MDDFSLPRTLGRGRTFVYLLPCRDQDLVKLGFSRQPLVRMRTLHRRFFELFDLERGWLLEVERLADARRIETSLIRRFGVHRSPAPLQVVDKAGGYSEWFRGISPEASAVFRGFAQEEGWSLHVLQTWVRDMFTAQADGLFDWSARMLQMIEYETFNVPPEHQRGVAAESLGYVMDACESVGMDTAQWFPDEVITWRRSR